MHPLLTPRYQIQNDHNRFKVLEVAGGCAVDQVQNLAISPCGLSQGRPSSDQAMCVRRLAISRE